MRKVVRGVFTLGMVLATISSVSADQKIQDDLVVVGSECVGLDCVNGEIFSFDTLRLKENNVRIKFDDTSSTGSFPYYDWQITINDSVNGGNNYFGIEDITSGTKPFTIMGRAPTNSLYVNGYGNVGFGTDSPMLNLHIKHNNTPSIRLEQDRSAGWSEQIWDIGANESTFFIRDVTNSGRLPFRIRHGAPTNSLFVDAVGRIGLGTSYPQAGLELAATHPTILLRNSVPSNNSWRVSGSSDFTLGTNTVTTDIFVVKSTAPTNSLVVDTDAVSISKGLAVTESATIGGSLTVTGNITSLGSVFNASDRNLKENIIKVKDNDILIKLDSLDISFWNYKTEDKTKRHIGPMAQDFYKIFKVGVDNKHISSLDAAAVAIASVKALHEKLREKDKEIAALQEQVEALKNVQDRMAKIEALLKQNRNITMQSKEERLLAKKYQDSEDAPMIEKSDEEVQAKEHDTYLYNGRDRKSDSK